MRRVRIRLRHLGVIAALLAFAVVLALALVPLSRTAQVGTGPTVQIKSTATQVTPAIAQSRQLTPAITQQTGATGIGEPVSGSRSSPVFAPTTAIILMAVLMIIGIAFAYMTQFFRTETDPMASIPDQKRGISIGGILKRDRIATWFQARREQFAERMAVVWLSARGVFSAPSTFR